MTPTAPTGSGDFSVMTINVRFGLADSGQFSWENRKPAFCELFKIWQPDFIAMQEVNGFQGTFLKKILHQYNCLGERRPAPPFWQNVLIFYKKNWQCRTGQHFFLSETPHVPSRMPDSRWPRQAVIGDFIDGTRRVVCLNTHFDFSQTVQVKSVAILLEHLAFFAEADSPEIITGDFNAAPGDECHQHLTDKSRIAAPFCDSLDRDAPGTFHNFTGQPVGDRIDWILWRHRARLKTSRIITERFAGTYPSDHFPVYASFEYIQRG